MACTTQFVPVGRTGSSMRLTDGLSFFFFYRRLHRRSSMMFIHVVFHYRVQDGGKIMTCFWLVLGSTMVMHLNVLLFDDDSSLASKKSR